ncbi:MAG: HAMP domain-containing sensor histidine kinase, partial [Vicinamibacterales bacterium]
KLDDPFGAYAMLGGARTISISNGTDEILVAASGSAENLSILQQMGVGSLLTVPLRARGRLLGAVTFVSATAGGAHSDDDVRLAQDLADRGALALDNAQLYENALLQQQNAEEANRAKSAFLGAMSHELRTPLNAIGGYVELLDMGLRGPVTREQHADLERVRQNQQQLIVLITEILNYARLGGGHATYNVIDFSACDVLARAVDVLGPLVERKNLECKATIEDTTIVCRADPEKVTQILVNLLSNAIKFTGSGGRISAQCEATADEVRYIIADTGIGIPASKFEKIFEPFVQLKDSLTEREGGVGLGLAISRDLAIAMNGGLHVESIEGSGSRFTLELPRVPLLEPVATNLA